MRNPTSSACIVPLQAATNDKASTHCNAVKMKLRDLSTCLFRLGQVESQRMWSGMGGCRATYKGECRNGRA